MDFNFSEEQQMVADGVERFVRESYSLDQRRKLAATPDGFSRENWAMFAEMGWLALVLPEDVGGLNFSLTEVAVVMAGLGRGPVLEPYVPSAILCAHLVDKAAAGPLREEVLGQVGAGELMLAFAHDEQNSVTALSLAGPQAVNAKADKLAGGYALTGRKTMALGGDCANKFVISAKIGADAAPSLFLVDRDTPGLTVTPYKLIDHTQAADVAFDGMVVGEDALLGAAPDTAAIIAEALDRATFALLAEAVGGMEACLDVCSDYLKTRKQFGQPLGNFQALQHILADMFVEAQEARSLLYFLLSQMDAPAAQRAKAISLAKIGIGEGSFIVAASSIQLHGGYGVTDEYAVSHYFRRLLTIKKLFGDVEDHLMRVA